MTVSIKDVAKKAGVSHSTVSRALHGSALISDETSQRIRQAALEMGYQPSAAARSLKTKRSQVLGVVLRSIDDPFFSEILQGIEDVAQANGYSLFIAASHQDPQRESAIVQTMGEHRVEGLVICSTSFSALHAHQLEKAGLPMVIINNQSAEAYRYSIYHDDIDGSRQVTRHLIEQGHKHIAYLGNASSGRTTLDRLSGYQAEMAAAGLSVPDHYIHQVEGGGAEEGYLAADYFLGLTPRPSAIVCYNDMLATGVLKRLRQAGVLVPQDISITGFDNIVLSAYTYPPLTTFDQPKRFIGSEAARLILGLLDNSCEKVPAEGSKIHILRGQLLVRESTAAPSER